MKGSEESAIAWAHITENMGQLEGFSFSTKAIRHHFNQLLTKRKAQVNAEKRASGINVELTELQVLLDEIKDDMEKCKEMILSETEQKRLADLEEKKKTYSHLLTKINGDRIRKCYAFYARKTIKRRRNMTITPNLEQRN